MHLYVLFIENFISTSQNFGPTEHLYFLGGFVNSIELDHYATKRSLQQQLSKSIKQ